jgi:hypothetical protein
MVQPLPAEASAPAAQEHLAASDPGSQQPATWRRLLWAQCAERGRKWWDSAEFRRRRHASGDNMRGAMMDFPLTSQPILERVGKSFPAVLISTEDSSAVACVNAHIFRGEIASPDASDATSAMQIHDDGHIVR